MKRIAQRGVAILIALVVIAIAAGIAGRMIWDRNLELHRTENLLRFQQNYEYALGAESWIGSLMHEELGTGPTVSLTQTWAQRLPPFPIPHGAIAGQVSDLQGLFNINNLAAQGGGVDPDQLGVFERLLAELRIDPDVAQAVASWVASTPGGSPSSLDSTYAAEDPPYRAPMAPMASTTELRLVAGLNFDQYQQLRLWVVALPIPTALNVNTAPLQVLDALVPGVTSAALAAIAKQQRSGGFDSVSQFEGLLGQTVTIPIGTDSSFFRLRLDIHFAGSRFHLSSMLYREPSGFFRVYTQTLGTGS
jgi:general secretion pathway protein K